MKKLLNKDILLFPNLYNSGLSSWAIAKRFNVDHKTILSHLKRLGVERRNRSSAAKEGVKVGRIIIKKHNLPENLTLDENLSYILGVLCGDGYMDYNSKRRNYCLGLSAVDREFVNYFKFCLFNFFKIKSTKEFKKSRNENWKDQFVTRLCSKNACDFINSIGNFKGDIWRIPEVIKNSSDRVRSAFLKGFFDSEGEIDKKIGRVGAVSINFEGLEEIGILLNGLGIKFTIIKKKDLRPNTSQKYVLRIHDKNSIKLFYELIGFTIKRKQEILIKFVSNWFEL
jgi:intein-encoded DNA endonuclease-like protein